MMTRQIGLMAMAGALALLGVGGAARAQGWNGQPDDRYAPPPGGYEQPDSDQDGTPPPTSSSHGYEPQTYGNPAADSQYGAQGYGNRMDQREDADDSRDGERGDDGAQYGSGQYDSRDDYGAGDRDQPRPGYDPRSGPANGDRAGANTREDIAADRCAAAVERDSRRYDRSARVEDINDVTPDSRGWRVQGVMLGDNGRSRRSFACTIGARGLPALSYGAPVRAR